MTYKFMHDPWTASIIEIYVGTDGFRLVGFDANGELFVRQKIRYAGHPPILPVHAVSSIRHFGLDQVIRRDDRKGPQRGTDLPLGVIFTTTANGLLLPVLRAAPMELIQIARKFPVGPGEGVP